MRHKVLFKLPSTSQNDEGGIEVDTYTTTITTWAFVREVNQARAVEITGSALLHTKEIYIRWAEARDVITKDWLVTYRGEDYVIHEKEYLHVHPDVAEGRFDLHTTFEKAGLYRGWVQFNADGKIHTIDFTMNVTQGTAEDIKKENEAHTNYHTDGSDDHSNH